MRVGFGYCGGGFASCMDEISMVGLVEPRRGWDSLQFGRRGGCLQWSQFRKGMTDPGANTFS